uniref:Ras association domain-containing protein n=1 Tax=Denticeps clupeoides TaxID=299321 RepID=A0AAY4DVU9_9TELE
MEVKVCVEGVQRVVCGVTEKTTCQEVVIALAQALGRAGRYTLNERFKEYERHVTPDERLLESLEKYGPHAGDVQLTLHHNGPPAEDVGGKPRISENQLYI